MTQLRDTAEGRIEPIDRETIAAASASEAGESTAGSKAFVVQERTDLHRIVIVGGGAGGLELATRLGDTLGKRNKAHITLIEKARTHFWKPHLHEIAAGSMDVGVYQTQLPRAIPLASFPLPYRRDGRASIARRARSSSRRTSTRTATASRRRAASATTRW